MNETNKTSGKKNIGKRIGMTVLGIAAVMLLIVAGYVAYVILSYDRNPQAEYGIHRRHL